ncbi:MAG: S8 family serine peptidase [candidate division WOR-3 bacterium]
MKNALLVLMVLVATGLGIITPELERHMATAGNNRLPVHIVLKEQFDKELLNSLVSDLPKAERRVAVAQILQEFSRREQTGLLAYLQEQEALGAVADIRPLWIVNAVYCEATPEVIRQLSERDEVNYVNYDLAYAPGLLEPAGEPEEPKDEITWGVRKINAPQVWALGYTGQNVICGHIDTGCDYTHPDLADHLWTDPNYPYHGWNFEQNNNNPMDVNGHGTHTAGTVASDGTAGSQCGVAPDAQIMICRVRTIADSVAESQCWQAMQFVVAPPLSPSHGADLYTMSLGWLISWNPHQATWRQAADNVNAAGLIQCVAAGNERSISPPNSCRCPGKVPPPWWNPQNTGTGTLSGIMSIGATDSLDRYADFSSRGPVTWQGIAPYNDYAYPPGLTRPDMAGPGVAVKSCAIGGGYRNMDGTSMATPHVAGTVCLMLSKNPNLSPRAVDSILELTAVDLGTPGKDNDYGAGRIDALAAVNYIGGVNPPMIVLRQLMIHDSLPGGNGNGRIEPGELARLRMRLVNTGGSACNNTQGTFRSTDSRLVVTDSLAGWGNIPAGDSATNATDPFAVQASNLIPPGTVVSCTLFITGDSAEYSTKIPITLTIGVPAPQPGTIIWGPKVCPGMPSQWGLYGVAYNPNDNLIYCMYFMSPTVYKYTSDSLLQAMGTVTLPEDSCTDIDYNSYDNTFWILSNPRKTVYKITPTGSVVRQFTVPQAEYPCGLVEHEETHLIYVSDRRSTTTTEQRYFIYDTLGNILDTLVHPVSGTYGTRCLALDYRSPSNGPSLLNMFSWFDATGTYLDSCAMLELDRVNNTLLNRFRFANTEWNMRGIECDPRDGSYWVTIMEYASGSNNQILKVAGFNMGVGVEEGKPGLLPRTGGIALRAMPNPFTGQTVISLQLPAPATVDLAVYDNTGRIVRRLAAGQPVGQSSSFTWDGHDQQGRKVAPGIYFYRLRSSLGEAWEKLVVTR